MKNFLGQSYPNNAGTRKMAQQLGTYIVLKFKSTQVLFPAPTLGDPQTPVILLQEDPTPLGLFRTRVYIYLPTQRHTLIM